MSQHSLLTVARCVTNVFFVLVVKAGIKPWIYHTKNLSFGCARDLILNLCF